MNLYAFGAFSIIPANAILWFFILAGRKHDPVVRSYLKWSASVAVWAFGYGITLSGHFSPEVSLLWNRLCHAFAVFIPVFFLELVMNLIQKDPIKSRSMRLIYIGGMILFGVAWTDLLVRGLWTMTGAGYQPLAGPIYWVFSVFFWIVVCEGLVLLFLKMRQLTGRERQQVKIFMIGSAIGYLGGSTLFIQAYEFAMPLVGVFFISSYVLFTGYAIYKYGFMDVELIVRRATVFAGLFVFVYGIFALFMALGQQYFVGGLGWPSWSAMIPSILVITIALRPLENWLINTTDRYLFQKDYDYHELMRLFTTEVLTIFDLEQVAKHTVEALDNIIKLESCAVLLLDERTSNFRVVAEVGLKDSGIAFDPNDSFIQHFRQTQRPLGRDVDIRQVGENHGASLQRLSSEICIPIAFNKELIGVLSLGRKKSGDPYTKDDIAVLESLARTEAIAIKNARVNADLVKAKARQHLGDMADGMSHQFNNRFGTIVALLGFQEILIPEALGELEKSDSQEQNQRLRATLDQALKAIAEARDSAYRGGEIAKTLLVHTRPEKIGFGMYDIGKGIPLGVNLVALKHDDFKTIRIVQSIDNPLPVTWCSLSIIQEILLITLDNAYDAIKTRQQESPGHEGVIQIQVTHRPAENNIRMVVKDNGVGMKTADLEKVNTGIPYFTTKGSASQKSGYGAGVHTLGEYVGILRGRHRYESQYGEGTSCIIDVPVSLKPIPIMEPADDKNSHSR